MDNKKTTQNINSTKKQNSIVSSDEDYLKTVESTLDEWNSQYDEEDYDDKNAKIIP